MKNIYLGYHFTIVPKELGSDILLAQLQDTTFESFMETDEGLSAYVQKELWNEAILANVAILNDKTFTIDYTYEEIQQVNWNEEWEKNFSPIDVGTICRIRAPFHNKTEALYDIVIEPKMSFGTGHHETTFMMIQLLLEADLVGKSVLDMGCGTAILAILAEMKGAKTIDAIDIDTWCYRNAVENVKINHCKNVHVYEGTVEHIVSKKYDIIIANINRNILLHDMQHYVNSLNIKGILLLSGFYTEDIPYIEASCTEKALRQVKKKEKNNWVALQFNKK